jgi:hypothetical protein
MGEQHRFTKSDGAATRDNRLGDAGEALGAGEIGFGEGEGDQRRAGWFDAEAEPAGDVVRKAGRAEFRDRQAAGGEDEGAGCDGAGIGLDAEMLGFGDVDDAAAELDRDMGGFGLGEQHGDDGAGRTVAE